MQRGAFGANQDMIDSLVGTSPSDWLTAQFALPSTRILPALETAFENGNAVDNRAHGSAFWDAMIENDDQLRQRMVFALSQILVVSDKDMGDRPLTMAHYIDVLQQHAFGNYRDLLQDVTYSPAMARYLTYLRNRKGEERTGRMPDENYARELVQLFTLGLVELNIDGTPKLGTGGEPIEIYGNEDIVGLARVFTGLSLKGSGFWDEDPDGHYSRLIAFDDKHSPLEKSFLGTTISAGTQTDASISQALDHIFDHPNMAPFFARQLIQRFTQSHPDPDYVARVAGAFETGQYISKDEVSFGTGQRGDLKATLAAVLLDEQFFDDTPATLAEGKIREPVLRFIHWARAFDVRNIRADNEWMLLYGAGKNTRLSQAPFGSPSVFNFYRPGFTAPGSATGTMDLTAPEFQIVNEGYLVGYSNFMMNFIFDTSPMRDDNINSFLPDYSDELAMVETPEGLADHLNRLLLSGRMSDESRTRMVTAINEIPIRTNTAENTNKDKLTRVHIAVFMAVTDPAFAIDL